jgi:hypothetical protein
MVVAWRAYSSRWSVIEVVSIGDTERVTYSGFPGTRHLAVMIGMKGVRIIARGEDALHITIETRAARLLLVSF